MTYPWIMNAEFCPNFEEETGRIEPGLDPINSPVKDETAMNLLRLESRIDGVVDYLARLKVAMSRATGAIALEPQTMAVVRRMDEVLTTVEGSGTPAATQAALIACREAKLSVPSSTRSWARTRRPKLMRPF